MHYDRFSKKQLTAMLWWDMPQYKDHDAIICDGSIRSGKTLSMTDGFVMWSMSRYDNQSFAICGKTIESLRRNVITLMPQWLGGIFKITERRSENLLIIEGGGHTNRYYLFGGRDESSYALIQGITLAGVMLDEVALMPRSFVEQALGRCSVPGSKFWFNCNPGGPQHWFFIEWIKGNQPRKHNCLHLHFTMEDNLSLDESIRRRYETTWQGVFYQRYVLGLWKAAEGRIYDMFDRDKHVVSAPPGKCSRYYVSMDHGTYNATAMILWGECKGVWYALKEYYHSGRGPGGQKTTGEYYTELEKLVGDLPIKAVVVDPAAAAMIAEIRKAKRFFVKGANNSVIAGINFTADAINSGKIKFCECCKMLISETEGYVWDEKASERGEDTPLKVDDHAVDAIRYFAFTIMRNPIIQYA